MNEKNGELVRYSPLTGMMIHNVELVTIGNRHRQKGGTEVLDVSILYRQEGKLYELKTIAFGHSDTEDIEVEVIHE
jgi:hypothetical protein